MHAVCSLQFCMLPFKCMSAREEGSNAINLSDPLCEWHLLFLFCCWLSCLIWEFGPFGWVDKTNVGNDICETEPFFHLLWPGKTRITISILSSISLSVVLHFHQFPQSPSATQPAATAPIGLTSHSPKYRRGRTAPLLEFNLLFYSHHPIKKPQRRQQSSVP